VNVLLIGLGRWGEKHLRVLRELGATLWVSDVSPPRLDWAVGQGVDRTHAVADYRQALAAVDAVDIVTPADSHLALASACLGAGRPCFVEKPLTSTVDEGRALVAAARNAGRIVQVGHIFRFHPVTAALRSLVDAGRLGAVRYATGRFSGFKRPRTDVGVTHTDGIHYFDLFAYLLGRDATRVQSVQRDFLGRGLDDMSVTTVFYGDTPVIVEANYFVPGTHRECVVIGERGAVVADYGASTVTLYAGEHRRQGAAWDAVDTGKEDIPTAQEEPLRLELASFLDAAGGRRPCPVDAEIGLRAVEVVEASAIAARLGRVVDLSEIRRA
jgi:UDP-N-acetylglucosamine 3-dehydrogenase